MQSSSPFKAPSTLAFVLIGAVQGLLVYAFGEWFDDLRPKDDLYPVAAAFLVAAVTSAPVYALSRFGLPPVRAASLAAMFSGVMGALIALHAWRLSIMPSSAFIWLTIAAGLAIVSWARAQGLTKASPLGERVMLCLWSSALSFLVALAVAGVVLGLISLAGEIVRMVGAERLHDALTHASVMSISFCSAGAFMLAIIAGRDTMMDGVVSVVVLAARALFPVIGLLMLLVIYAVGAGSLDAIPRYISLAALSLGLAGAAALLGLTSRISTPNPSAFVRQVHRLVWFTVPVVTGIAIYAAWLRIAAYGLTPERILLIAISITLLVISVGNAASVKQFKFAKVTNTALRSAFAAALAFFVAGLAPGISWIDMSVKSQSGRIFNAEDDFNPGVAHFLWHELGETGKRVVRSAEATLDAQDRALLEELKDQSWYVAALEDPISAKAEREALLKTLPVLPEGARLPEQFAASAVNAKDYFMRQSFMEVCGKAADDPPRQCKVVIADIMPSRPGKEIVLVGSAKQPFKVLFALQPGKTDTWQLITWLRHYESEESLRSDMEGDTDASPVNLPKEPLIRDIIIDGERFGF